MKAHFWSPNSFKARRVANGFSQRELGELAGVGTRLISDLGERRLFGWML